MGNKIELILEKHNNIIVLSKNVNQRSQSKLAGWLFLLHFLKINSSKEDFLCYMKSNLIIPKTSN